MTMPQSKKPETPTILQCSGPDAVRFLNGQLTQDTRDLADEARSSCITNAKGRLEHFVSICHGPEPEQVWVISTHGEADALHNRLDKYLIADDVILSDQTGQWQRIHSEQALEGASFTRSCPGIWGLGVDNWFPSGSTPTIAALADDEVEQRRIQEGIPLWGKELEVGMLPPEAGLDRSATSFHKGCYIGQEVISRIRSAGKLNRRLALFAIQGEAVPGTNLVHDDATCGVITSVSPNGKFALGYVTKKAFEATRYELANGLAERTRWA
ncbi:MAG: YgfZ/GcvT domain-containing protein [Verrucomicrobiales bacterium]